MAVLIGLSFYDELKAAGLDSVAMVWSSNGTITYRKGVTSAKKLAVEGVLAAHDPRTARADPRAVLKQAVRDATTVATLRTAVLNLIE